MKNIEVSKSILYEDINKLLSSFSKKERKYAPQFWENHTHVIVESECMNEEWCFLWFKSAGCSKEKSGSCLMCKYGSANAVSQNEIFKSFLIGMNLIDRDYDFFFCSVSGSMLENNELSSNTYFDIVNALSKTTHKSFGFETRCETVNRIIIKKTQFILKGRLNQVFLGLEVSDQNILRFCLNKNQKLSDFCSAINILNEFKVNVCVNILVGIPFFNIDERINMAIQSVRWAFKNGASRCFLFPLHVKENTIIGTLYNLGQYDPPLLWELIEVLAMFPQEISDNKLGISWYKPQKGDSSILTSPTTCPLCIDKVQSLLEEYDKRPDYLIIQHLQAIKCSCYYDWQESKKLSSQFTVDRLVHSYKSLWDYYNDTEKKNDDFIKKYKPLLESAMSKYNGKF